MHLLPYVICCFQDKDAKVAFLTKIIDVVGIVLGEHVPAKPLKVCKPMNQLNDLLQRRHADGYLG